MAVVGIRYSEKDPVIALALDTVAMGKQALVFVNSKSSAESVAEAVASALAKTKSRGGSRDREGCIGEEAGDASDELAGDAANALIPGELTSEQARLAELADSVRNALSRPTRQCDRLARCVRSGAAFHHAGLAMAQRSAIEDAFKSGLIRIIVCTPTLAAGIDMPAFRAIIRDLKRFGGRGMNWIPVLEYLQQAGRAGRPSFDSYGEAIAISGSEKLKDTIYERYICGVPEDISSKLAVEPVLRTALLSLIATGVVRTSSEALDFFSRTLWARQFGDMGYLQSIILKTVTMLKEWGFVTSDSVECSSESIDQGFIDADMLQGNEQIAPTLIGKRVAELYIDPLTAHEIIEKLGEAARKGVRPFSLLHMAASSIEMRPWLSVRSKELEGIEEGLARHGPFILGRTPSEFDFDYGEFLCSVKTALFLHSWIEEKDEVYLLENFSIRPGELRVKLDTADWLLYAAQEFSRMLNYKAVFPSVTKTRLRLKYGVREELLPLLRLRGIGRVRARRLYFNNIRNIGDIKSADFRALAKILGEKLAQSVKEQVGQGKADENALRVDLHGF
ncbi:hypothetical protein COT48_02285 [Candidatus Woesearchaeota archaeon CG08_land_8_20_14_0_20_47_9]|nr:MAG: hypothetical protein COT48_02285 [Candidatus Woesearchaeota archaeon CG08_land_8_20_14_0_20_47_9]